MASDTRNLRIRMLLEAADRFSKPFRALGAGARKTGADIKATREALRSLERVSGDISSFRKLKGGLSDTTAELGKAQAKVTELKRAIDATDSPTKKLTSDFAKAKREAAGLKEQHSRESTELQRLRDRLAAAGIATNNLVQGERQLRDRVAATNRELATQERRLSRSQRISNARGALAAGQEATNRGFQSGVAKITAGAAMALPAISVSRDAMDFQSVMADVKKVVNFSPGNNIQKLSDQVLQLSTRLPMTAEGIGQIVAAAGRSGIADTELLGFAEDATKMAVAFDKSADEAGTMMATWRTAFAMNREGVRHLGDQVNALTNKYGGNVNVVTDMVTAVGPLGRVAGTTSGELAGMAQMMAKLGIESEVGATGIKNTLIRLSMGAALVPKARKALESLGLSATVVARRMQKDAGGTIIDVFTRISKLRKDRQVGVLTQLFGRESILAIAPLLTNLDQLRTNFKMVNDQVQVAGSMEREYASRAGTTANAVQLARNNFEVLKITLGTQLLPTIMHLSASFIRIIGHVRAFTQQHPLLTKWLLLGTSALAAFAVTMGVVGIAMQGILAPFRALGVAAELLGTTKAGLILRFGKALLYPLRVIPLFVKAIDFLGAGVVRVGALMLANPLVAAITAIVLALAVAGYLIYKHWDTIKRAFGAALTYLGGLWTQFKQIGVQIIAGLVNAFLNPGATLMSAVFGLGGKIVGWFKKKLGIHSPSRVFHAMGGHLMTGLANGMAAGEHGPLGRIDRLSRRLGTALALGAAAPAIAGGHGATPAGGPGIYIGAIHIHGAPGQDEKAIAEAVEAKLLQLGYGRPVPRRASFADDPDWRNA